MSIKDTNSQTTEQVDFLITGMTCAACSARIEKGLNKVDGVAMAVVNLALETATVEYHPSMVQVQDLIQKVEHLGYGAEQKEAAGQENEDPRELELQVQKGRFLFAMLLSFPMALVMLADMAKVPDTLGIQAFFMNPWVGLALASPVQLFIGLQFYRGAFKAIRSGSANMDVLVALGTSAGFFLVCTFYITLTEQAR